MGAFHWSFAKSKALRSIPAHRRSRYSWRTHNCCVDSQLHRDTGFSLSSSRLSFPLLRHRSSIPTPPTTFGLVTADNQISARSKGNTSRQNVPVYNAAPPRRKPGSVQGTQYSRLTCTIPSLATNEFPGSIQFGVYVLFPIGWMYYFGTNLEERFAVPDFWPKKEQSHKIPMDKSEIELELARMNRERDRRIMERKAREEQLQMQASESCAADS